MALLRKSLNADSGELDLRWFETELARSRRTERPLTTVVFSESDEGTPAERTLRWIGRRGKSLLNDLSQHVQSEVRRSDYVISSTTGNQVVVVAPETQPHEVDRLVTRVCDLAPTSINWGAASFPEDGSNLDELIDAARSRSSHSYSVSETRDA